MASRNKKITDQELDMPVVENKPETKKEEKHERKLATVSWFVLLFVGLSQMLPVQLGPVLNWSVAGITLQMAVGVFAVALALNFLFRE